MKSKYDIWQKLKKEDKMKLTYERFIMNYFPYTFWAPAKKKLEVLMKYLKEGNTLDAGCGTGWASLYLLEKGYNPISVDLSKEALKECKIVVEELGINGNFINKNLNELPFPDNHFKTIFCFEVLEHINDLDKTLLELNRVLNNDGILILSIPNKFGSFAILHDYIIKPIYMRLLGPKRDLIRDIHVQLHGLNWWIDKFYDNNFELVKTINLEFLIPVFVLFGYRRTSRLAKFDVDLAEKVSSKIVSGWIFVLRVKNESI